MLAINANAQELKSTDVLDDVKKNKCSSIKWVYY